MSYGSKRWSMGYGCGLALGVSMANNFDMFALGLAIVLWFLDFFIPEKADA